MTRPETASGSEFGDAKQARKLQQISAASPSRLGLFRRIYSRQASPRAAIKGQCLDCMGLDEVAVRECSSTACTLWSFRPFTRRATASGESEAR